MVKDIGRENTLRLAAQRRGLRLERSTQRDPKAPDLIRYWLVDAKTDAVLEGFGPGGTPGATLDDVEAYLTGNAERPR